MESQLFLKSQQFHSYLGNFHHSVKPEPEIGRRGWGQKEHNFGGKFPGIVHFGQLESEAIWAAVSTGFIHGPRYFDVLNSSRIT
jgi:hypothetical protein